MGIVTGQGLAGLVRERFGVRLGRARASPRSWSPTSGRPAPSSPASRPASSSPGSSRLRRACPSRPSRCRSLVLRGGFRRVEHVLLALATVFAAYIVAGLLAGPGLGGGRERARRADACPAGRDALVAVTATVGTTLAPWGLAFIQSYAVDKRLSTSTARLERVDVVTGAVMTGVIGFFVVVACAATLHADGRSIDDGRRRGRGARAARRASSPRCCSAPACSAPRCWRPRSCRSSTAYSVSEFLGYEAALDDPRARGAALLRQLRR